LKQQVANQESLLLAERELLSEVRRDKETLQKQLELVTFGPPAPKVVFWARLLGRGKKVGPKEGEN
jgi:hypothetical protein